MKRTLFAALLVVPMGAAFAQQSSIEATKANAMNVFAQVKSAAAQINASAVNAQPQLQDKYRAMAQHADKAIEALKASFKATSDPIVALEALAEAKNAARAIESTVIAIKANNVAEAAAEAKATARAIEGTAKAVRDVAAETAAKAVSQAAADIKASAR